jgi:hypothetical protein
MQNDAVTRFLKGRGVPDDVVESGLEGLVRAWERTDSQVRAGYPLGLDDYLNDVDGRQLIEEAVSAAPDALTETLRRRIEAADVAIQQAIVPADECLWGDELADREGWTAGDNWWYFGLPRNPGPQMLEELEDFE